MSDSVWTWNNRSNGEAFQYVHSEWAILWNNRTRCPQENMFSSFQHREGSSVLLRGGSAPRNKTEPALRRRTVVGLSVSSQRHTPVWNHQETEWWVWSGTHRVEGIQRIVPHEERFSHSFLSTEGVILYTKQNSSVITEEFFLICVTTEPAHDSPYH